MSHKTNNSYHLRDLLQPLQVGKTAEVPVIDVTFLYPCQIQRWKVVEKAPL